MTAGELFVTIGIKGQDAALKAVSSIKSGLAEIGESSMATKAALAGVVYGLEQMMATSMRTGAELRTFETVTGQSAVTLQKYQYLARQVNVSNEDMTASFKGIQKTMNDMLLTGQVPPGLKFLFQKVGFDPSRARDIPYVIEKLRDAAKTLPADVFSRFAQSLGATEGFISFAIRSKGEIKDVKDSMVMSEAQITALAKVDAAWANLWNTFKLFAAGGTAKFGMFAVGELQNAYKMVMRLWEGFEKISKTMPALKIAFVAIAGAIAIAFAPISSLILGLIYIFGELEKEMEGKDNMFRQVGKWLDEHGMGGPKVGKDIGAYGGGDPMAAFGGFKGNAEKDAGPSNRSMINHYNIQSHDPHGVAKEIEKIHERQNRAYLSQVMTGGVQN